MVLRITQNESDAGAILRLEGRLLWEWAALLERECAELLSTGNQLSLDLSGVTFVDRAGVEALRRLSQAGAMILCPSGPVASVLEEAGIRVGLDADGAGDGRH